MNGDSAYKWTQTLINGKTNLLLSLLFTTLWYFLLICCKYLLIQKNTEVSYARLSSAFPAWRHERARLDQNGARLEEGVFALATGDGAANSGLPLIERALFYGRHE